MSFDTYKSLAYSDEDSLMLLEQNNQNTYLARFYYANTQFENMNFGIANTRNKEEFNKIGGSNNPDWKTLTFKEFIYRRKLIGLELQDRLDSLFQMKKTENYDCYESKNSYIIHVPIYHFRIFGPNTKYSFSKQLLDKPDLYFIKITDNDWKFEKTIADGFSKISIDNFSKIIEMWSPFLSLLMTESKYAHGIY